MVKKTPKQIAAIKKAKQNKDTKVIDVAITKPSSWDNMRPKERLLYLHNTYNDFKAKGIRHEKLHKAILKMLNQMEQDIEMGNADKWR